MIVNQRMTLTMLISNLNYSKSTNRQRKEKNQRMEVYKEILIG
jgi:hypothetical protein